MVSWQYFCVILLRCYTFSPPGVFILHFLTSTFTVANCHSFPVEHWRQQISRETRALMPAVPNLALGRPKSEFGGHPATQGANIVLKILVVWVTFVSKLLSSISKSEIYFFLKYLYTTETERHRQAGDVENTQFSFGSPRRDPFFDPYFLPYALCNMEVW